MEAICSWQEVICEFIGDMTRLIQCSSVITRATARQHSSHLICPALRMLLGHDNYSWRPMDGPHSH